MKNYEQSMFVNEMIERIRADILVKITIGTIPESWDGVELRQYIAERFNECIMKETLTGKRKREYKNTKLINNL